MCYLVPTTHVAALDLLARATSGFREAAPLLFSIALLTGDTTRLGSLVIESRTKTVYTLANSSGSTLPFAGKPGKTQHVVPAEAVPEGLMASDWTNIRAAYQANRHQTVKVKGGYAARNPEQQWRADFDGRGFTTRPDAGGWHWGLELKSYGFHGQKHAIGGRPEVRAEGQRVTYIWDATVREWFFNDQRGLEHGFTVEERPAGANDADARLEFDLVVRGNLRPEISADGATMDFLDPNGTAMLTYFGLKVLDAGGNNLSARFVSSQENAVRLTVDDRGARYPITVDPIAQQAYLKASNTEVDDSFGYSVAISGDTVVVGAPYEDSNATGINGDETDNSAPVSGAAYVFVRSGTTWSQQAYLKASNTGLFDDFGESVAVSGDTIIVGARFEDSNATGVNGNQTNNSALDSGAAYVFIRNGTTWSQQAYLKASNTEVDDSFGYSVAISGDTVVVGALYEDSNATGINGDQTDNSASEAGAAYVFVRNGTTWSQQAYLKASNTDDYSAFGGSVAVSGDTVVVGAVGERSNAVGVGGNQNDTSAPYSGAAYVFVRNGTIWSQQAYLKACNTGSGDDFGASVAVSGDAVVVGAPFEDSNASGVGGCQTDNSASGAGAVYVFVRNGTTWSQQAYLKASNTGVGDYFGYSVAISGNAVIVSAIGEDSDAVGINGDPNNNNGIDSGAAYVFVRNGATWSQQAYLKASNTGLFDTFGWIVSVSGDTVLVGAPFESSDATGTNGDETNDNAPSSGASYVFALACPGTIFDQDFDGVVAPALPTGWVATNGAGAALLWGTSTTSPDTAPNDAFVAAPSTISDKRLETPDIAISSTTTQVSFRNNFNLQSGFDGGVLEISINGGAFIDILDAAVGGSFVTGGYNATISPSTGSPIAGRMAWSGSSCGYFCTVANLGPNVNGTTIKLRFRLGTDNGVAAPGWRVDTFQVLLSGAVCGRCVSSTSPTLSPAKLLNISARAYVGTGNNVLIGGFIITGNAPKSVVLRGLGPSLTVPNPLADPTLELRDSNANVVYFNDDWRQVQQDELLALGLAPANDPESGMVLTIPPCTSYTAILAGKNGGTGVGVVEIYDVDPAADSELANFSARGFVQTGADVMIGGFILGGNTNSTRVALRGIGPSLPPPLSPLLADPTLELHGPVPFVTIANDNWGSNSTAANELSLRGLALQDPGESGIFTSLPPGAFTAILAGQNGTTGTGLFEIYNVH